MADVAGFIEAAGSRFSNLELIGRGSFGDVYKGYEAISVKRNKRKFNSFTLRVY